jgi:hypothetical protein
LNLSESWLLNPHLAVKHLPDDIALVVFRDPWFVFVAIMGAKAVKRSSFQVIARGIIVISREELPWSKVTMMHAVKNLARSVRIISGVPSTHNTHALPGCKEGRDANDKPNCRDCSPCTGGRADGEQDNAEKATKDTTNAELFSEELARWIAVADGPTNEVGMRLLTKRSLDSGEHFTESRRVSGVGECLQRGGTFSRRKIQFTCTTLGNIDGNNASYFLSERLNGD